MRRRYSKEFELDSISLFNEQGYSRVEATKSLDIGYELLGRWIREYTKDNEDAFRGRVKLRGEQEEIRQLREEVRRLKLEK